MDNSNIIVSGGHEDEDQVGDDWTDILIKLSVSGQKVVMSQKAAKESRITCRWPTTARWNRCAHGSTIADIAISCPLYCERFCHTFPLRKTLACGFWPADMLFC